MIRNKIGFKREEYLQELDKTELWDIIIIGGGATGLGAAVDAASRGYKTILLEQNDFAKGTSSRSTKLVHGGVRYLAQGNIGLVYEALHERGLLLKNAPHLVKKQSFIIPCYSWLDKIKYFVGLKMYDWLAGKYSFGRSRSLTRDELIGAVTEIQAKGLEGGIKYWDGQFDDARLAINLAQTAAKQGGILLNYIKVTNLIKTDKGRISGVIVRDIESDKIYNLYAKVVINATGVFVDQILQMDRAFQKPLVKPSQGVHVVLDRSFLSGDSAIMIPKTPDGRVLFAVPWHQHVLVGTTDTPLETYSLEPVALDKEITFILQTAGQYLVKAPTRANVLSVFAGLRPLAAPDKDTGATKEISRSHKLIVNDSGLITITGGKWTTYRKMAEDTIDKAIQIGRLPAKPCITGDLKIHGYTNDNTTTHLSGYGSDALLITTLIKAEPKLGELLDESQPYLKAEVIWAVRYEMARTVEDVLARRLRLLFLDAQAAINLAPAVAKLIATELNYELIWEEAQINSFNQLASKYLAQPITENKKYIC
ncbi:glycerol-3-phosphate dehydrogenase/oxidase [Mucilaginibacter panaciglaebae]|uniref:Glycerol-3-phosphate dehydrogenase/oxidase n=1 Tax=Mucilaginibacter panaciglaebae TaxID=502331 RepID=A0ABP7WBI8_9SPHI